MYEFVSPLLFTSILYDYSVLSMVLYYYQCIHGCYLSVNLIYCFNYPFFIQRINNKLQLSLSIKHPQFMSIWELSCHVRWADSSLSMCELLFTYYHIWLYYYLFYAILSQHQLLSYNISWILQLGKLSRHKIVWSRIPQPLMINFDIL